MILLEINVDTANINLFLRVDQSFFHIGSSSKLNIWSGKVFYSLKNSTNIQHFILFVWLFAIKIRHWFRTCDTDEVGRETEIKIAFINKWMVPMIMVFKRTGTPFVFVVPLNRLYQSASDTSSDLLSVYRGKYDEFKIGFVVFVISGWSFRISR